MEIIVKGSSLTRFGIEGTNYCGPGYADGKLLGDNEEATYRERATNPVDEACKTHDQAYDALKNSPNPAYDRMQADLRLIDEVSAALSSGELSAYDTAVAAAVIGAFVGKTALYDVPAAVIEAARNLLQRLLAALGTEGNPFTADFGYTPEILAPSDLVNDGFNDARSWFPRRDPLLLDLDGNGLETVGLAANIHFDHDGDGVLTKTGWAGKNDALLVWDRNANGTIDTGAELFGDFTPLPNGTLAPNGFAALAALDSNGDGILDASDPAFAELKLWRDADQNGLTGEGELISLLDAGIVSLNLANTLRNQRLSNGNTLTREGSFTRLDGSTSAMGEFRLAIDTFETQFAEQIEIPEKLKVLSNMQGAGSASLVNNGDILLAGEGKSRCWRDAGCANGDMWRKVA